MATPRIFISSTCFDLQDLRNNLNRFILAFGYEPVMSEFGDIFYDYNLHVQDACINEISKCQMFVLIIGNNYGSNYYKLKSNDKTPKSVTMSEFQGALEQQLPKHIFINRMVKYDYDNYKRFLSKKYEEYFSSNKVDVENIEVIKNEIKRKVEEDFPFNHESYRHIFKFIELIDNLVINNAIYTYENTIDIEEQLRKQWSNFMYESLLNSAKKINIKEDRISLNKLEKKIDKIESILEIAFNNKSRISEGETIDTDRIISEMKLSELEEMQDILSNSMNAILYNEFTFNDDKRRGKFEEEITFEVSKKWLDTLSELVKKYKWSKEIPFSKVFDGIEITEFEEDKNVPLKSLLELCSIYLRSDSEKNSIANSVQLKLKELERILSEDNISSFDFSNFSENSDDDEDDDVPF